MKLLIVDDEKHVRDAVKMLLGLRQWPFDTVLEAANGQEACELVERERPEIVLTDMMMPAMNGVKLLEWLNRHYPECRVVVISGYKNYEFMRSAIRNGGLDYILKPIQADQLHEVLERAIASWREERQRQSDRKASAEMHRLKPLYRNKMWTDLLKEGRVDERALAELGVAPGDGRTDTVQVCVLNPSVAVSAVRSKFGHHLDLLTYAILNIFDELLNHAKQGVAFRNLHRDHEVVLFLWTDAAPDRVREFNDVFRNIWGGAFLFGIGSPKPFPSGLSQSYAEARSAFMGINLFRHEQWAHVWHPREDGETPDLSLYPYEEQLFQALASGSVQRIRAVVGGWLEEARKRQQLTLEQLELWRYELRILLSRWTNRTFLQPTADWTYNIGSVPLKDRGTLDEQAWIEEWTAYLCGIADQYGTPQPDHPDPMKQIARYLEEHYTENISLQDLADRFYLSREYISRKFKQTYDTNVFEYIGRIRINKAKLLLLDPNMKISQIAWSVGYEDEKYFSKVFKRMEGVSPNEYRRQYLG